MTLNPMRANLRTSVLLGLVLAATSTTCLRAADYWVDGKRGSDSATSGSALATPWKTIHYALSNMPVPTGANGHTLHLVGGQTYSVQSNGERFPLRPLYNVTIQGYAASNAGWPVISIPAGATGFKFDPLVNYERNAVTFRYMKIDGGRYGVDMGGTPGKRHRPRIWQCEFRNQSESCARIVTRSNAEEDPRFALCLFEDSKSAITGFGNGNSVKFQPDIDECIFRRLRLNAFRVIDNTAGQSPIGGLVRNCQFFDVATAIYIESGRSATNTLTKITRSSFTDCGKAIHVRLNQTFDPTLTVEDSSFENCGSGIYFDGTAGAGPFVYNIVNNRFILGPKSNLAAIDYRVGAGSRITLDLSRNVIIGAPGRRNVGINFQPGRSVRQLTFLSNRDEIRGCATAMSFRPLYLYPELTVRGARLIDNTTAIEALAAPSQLSVVHSTIADNDFGIRGTRMRTVSNVLFSRNAKSNIVLSNKPTVEHCCFESGDSHAGQGNISGGASLLRPSYTLASTSKCIDAGRLNALSPATDFNGDPRSSVSKYQGNRVPDIGADEYVFAGSARSFGIAGYGNRGVHPKIAGLGTPSIGKQLGVRVSGAVGIFKTPCDLALLSLGAPGSAGMNLAPYGAALSYLYGGGIQWIAVMKPNATGDATANVSIPMNSSLVGGTVVMQWLVHAPWLNALGFVTSDGLRMTIGQ